MSMDAKKYFTELRILYEIAKSSGDSATGLRLLMLLLEEEPDKFEPKLSMEELSKKYGHPFKE